MQSNTENKFHSRLSSSLWINIKHYFLFALPFEKVLLFRLRFLVFVEWKKQEIFMNEWENECCFVSKGLNCKCQLNFLHKFFFGKVSQYNWVFQVVFVYPALNFFELSVLFHSINVNQLIRFHVCVYVYIEHCVVNG